ncbi:MAG: NapC/NirT family cytochrome c [Clostridiales bacterium]|nr:NapC/NirT family cytochrome c [Clostridiales bacterium]
MGQPKPFKFKFPDGRDPRIKRRAVASVMAVLLLFIVLVYSQDYRNPESCGLCHVMVPHVRTWEASAHQRTDCVTCHEGPGFDGVIRFQVSLAEMAYKYVTNTYYLPIAMREQMSAESCTNCHALNREMSPSGDLIVPHKNHEKVRVDCMSCHKGVVHANIASRQMALSVDVNIWTRRFSMSQMSYENRNLSMSGCIECHQLRRATLDCAACHKDIYFPESHVEETFTIQHGLQAYNDLLSCDRCHSWTRGAIEDSDMLAYGIHPVREYARNNIFCRDCHLERPEGHTQLWRGMHATKARTQGKFGCYVCHDFNRAILDTVKDPPFSRVFCSQCHYKKHKQGWQAVHPTNVNGQKYGYECLRCHGSNYCGRCHIIY